jgi:hypothetical protein
MSGPSLTDQRTAAQDDLPNLTPLYAVARPSGGYSVVARDDDNANVTHICRLEVVIDRRAIADLIKAVVALHPVVAAINDPRLNRALTELCAAAISLLPDPDGEPS